MRDATANEQPVLARFVSLNIINRCDVDQKLGLHETEIQHRPQRLAAGDEFRRTTVTGKPERRRHVGWPSIIEGHRLHGVPRAAAMVSRMRRGVIGEISMSAPTGRTAPFTAFVIAAPPPPYPPP